MNFSRVEIVPKFMTSGDLNRLKVIPGMEHVERVAKINVYRLACTQTLSADILNQVFLDWVINDVHYTDNGQTDNCDYICEVSFKPGVTDNSALAASEALELLGYKAQVASGFLFLITGSVDRSRLQKVAGRHFGNNLVQKIDVFTCSDFKKNLRFDQVDFPQVKLSHQIEACHIDLDVDEKQLMDISHRRCLALNLAEMQFIQKHFKKLGRKPTDVELEILAQTWSEHCKHKIFGAKINYNGAEIEGLYKTYIKNTTEEIRAQRQLEWLVSVFHDNAGVVSFDSEVDLCIKVETHNSPSALDPYGGAITGILGVNRDILGVGMGGFPIANTNVFCFADPGLKGIPSELKKPAIIMNGVHQGVEDGGNKSGIPTVNGSFYFDDGYAGKPLVFVGTVGVVPKKLADGSSGAKKRASIGDLVVMIGGAIGCDGIHGATFSSMELNENSPVSAVQIGDPLMQKRVTDFLRQAQNDLLYSAITDNGAGGLSSSVGEMATMTGGAKVFLERCPVKYPGLAPYELFISESQERMTLAVPQEKWSAFEKLAQKMGVSATAIGEFTGSGQLEVFYHQQLVADLDLHFMHESLVPLQLEACWQGPVVSDLESTNNIADSGQITLQLLDRLNVCSKESYVRRYDHEVQAATVVKPFVGVKGRGPSDAGAIWMAPHGGSEENSIVIGHGLNPRLSLYDPAIMAMVAVDEAIRNVVVVGGDIDRCCLVDNFCWPDPVKSSGNPDGDYKLGQLVRTCQAMAQICKDYGTPLVSGKDSMKNDYRSKDGTMISVLPTLLISAMACANTKHLVTSDFKKSGDLIYLVGKTTKGLLGSEYHQLVGGAQKLFEVDSKANLKTYRQYYQACQQGFINSGHDISDGGLAVALCESALGGKFGALLEFGEDVDLLFGEAPGRLVVTIDPSNRQQFEAIIGDCLLLGQVNNSGIIKGAGLNLNLEAISKAWRGRFNVDS